MSQAGLTRRAFLGGALALAAAGAGCSPPRPTAGGAPTVATLTAAQPFYIAHRGGGGNWPEMTAYAYAQAAQVPGLQAMEISVCLSADGVLVCSHDPTTARMTGTPYTIAEETWATLSTLKVSGSETTDPGQAAQPLTRFDDVVEAYIGRFVLFVEPKVKPAADPLMVRMAALDQPERVVWKSPINSPGFAEAKRRGFGTWGYVLNEPAHTGDNLARYAASADIDLIGAPQGESESFITQVTQAGRANGKQTIAWPIRSPADRERVLELGCTGMMTSNLRQVLGAER
jgi:glycerophosphoryl diester phosphodiesterase